MYIAICDDDSYIANQIKNEVCKCYNNTDENIEISVYGSGIELIEVIENQNMNYDMILLDVDMPGKTGLEVAKVLRDSNINAIIMFISSHDKYVFESFEYTPFRYIRKSRITEELHIALKSAYILYKKTRKKYIILKSDDEEYRVERSEICYYSIVKRRMTVHLFDKRVLVVWKTIKELQEELQSDDFVKIDSGCVVNMKYIKEYNNQTVTMDNGEKIFASRSGVKVLKEELNKYWRENI